jgi:hypothetical protein
MDMSDEQTQKIAANEKVAVTEDTEGHGTQTGSGDKSASEKVATASERFAQEKVAFAQEKASDDDTEGHSVLPPKPDSVATASERFAQEKVATASERFAQEKFAQEKFAQEK